MLSIRHGKPLFIQHQPILVCLSYLASIEINAITLGPIVISRNKIGEVTKNHEAIHFQQYLETLFIGFLLVYLWDWLMGGYSNTGMGAKLTSRLGPNKRPTDINKT